MRPFTSTISLEEAKRLLTESVRPIDRTESVPLAEAAGRVVARKVAAALDVPAFDRAAMDGYAVIAADTAEATAQSPASLRLIDRVYTGQVSGTTIVSGTCAEIATGAPLPAGADAVIMVEDTSADGGVVQLRAAVRPGQNIGRRAGDMRVGDVVVSPGEVLTPSRVGALAAIGQTAITVYARPKVAILSTGNEVVDAGQPLAPGQVYDVNRFTLSAIVSAHGGEPRSRRAAEDTIGSLIAALEACGDADLFVFSGGSSVGTRDLTTDLIAGRGRMIFHGVSIKPGKPTAFAIVDGTPFFGMPGNPTSCLSNAYILLVPYLRATARLPPYSPRVARARLGQRIASTANRHQFYPVRLDHGTAFPAFKGSGDITSLSRADGYIEIAAGQVGVEEGAAVDVTLF